MLPLRLALPIAVLLAAVALPPIGLAVAPPDLGSAAGYALVANTTITNTGVSLIDGNLALVGPSVTGLGGLVTGRSDIGNAAAARAEDDVLSAHHAATNAGSPIEMSGVDLGGKTLGPGVYHFGSSASLHGTLTLDGEGASNPTFIFQIGSTLTTGSGARVRLTNGADGCAVFWAVGSSATIGTGTSLQGNLMALVSITMTTGATIGVGGGRNGGRAFAQNGAITLDTNTVIAPTGSCNPPAPTPKPHTHAEADTKADTAADRRANPAADTHARPIRVDAAPCDAAADRLGPSRTASGGIGPALCDSARRTRHGRRSAAGRPTRPDRPGRRGRSRRTGDHRGRHRRRHWSIRGPRFPRRRFGLLADPADACPGARDDGVAARGPSAGRFVRLRAKPLERAAPGRLALHPQFFKVELPLDQAQGQVVDLAAIAQLDDRRPLRGDDAALDLLVLDALLPAFFRLVGVLGRQVPGPILEPRLEPVEEGLVTRPLLARALDLLEPGLVCGDARHGRLVALGFDAVPAGPAQDPRQGEPLPDERDEDHEERHEKDEIPLGKVGRESKGSCQGDGPAQSGPAHDERQAGGQRRIASRDGATWRPGQEARGEHPHDPTNDDDDADQDSQHEDLARRSIAQALEDRSAARAR